VIVTGEWVANSIVFIASLLGSPRLTARMNNLLTTQAEDTTCHVDGLKKDSKLSTHLQKKFTKTARSMVRKLTRPSRKALSKKWPATTKLAKGRETVLTPTMI
jgi:hypothetical protein